MTFRTASPKHVPPWRVVFRLAAAVLLLSGGCVDWLGSALPLDPGRIFFNDASAVPSELAVGGEPRYLRRAVFQSIPGKAGSHAAAVTALPDGELLAAWYSYEGPHELTGSAIYMSRLAPGVSAWQTPWLHIDRFEGDGNPVLYSEGERVWLFQAVLPGLWSTARIETQQSFDRGVTWSDPVSLPGPIGANVRFPPVRLANGALLLPAYDDLLQRSLFYGSANGSDWSLLGAVTTNPAAIQPCVAVLPGGDLLAVMRNTGGGSMWVMGSGDSGWTWTAPQASGFPNPGSPAALSLLASGNLVLVYNDDAGERIRLTAAISADGGVTWPHRRLLTNEAENCSYPTMIQAPDGMIHVLFSVGRERIDQVALNEAWLVSGEGSQ